MMEIFKIKLDMYLPNLEVKPFSAIDKSNIEFDTK